MRVAARSVRRLWAPAVAGTGALLAVTSRSADKPSLVVSRSARPAFSVCSASKPWRRSAFSVVGLCGALEGALRGFTAVAAEPLETVALPLHDLSELHVHFGGDANVDDNQPMLQTAPSGGTISALSVQIPALEKLAPYLSQPGAQIFDLGFGSGVMMAMMLAVAGEDAKVYGVDLADKIAVASANLTMRHSNCPFVPFPKESFELIGGDAFQQLALWESQGKMFDIVYSGCSMDQRTDQLRRFLGRLKPKGVAVFNLGTSGRQGMYFVADGGKVCELLMRVNFMMAVSPQTPPVVGQNIPLDPDKLGAWIRANVFAPSQEL